MTSSMSSSPGKLGRANCTLDPVRAPEKYFVFLEFGLNLNQGCRGVGTGFPHLFLYHYTPDYLAKTIAYFFIQNFYDHYSTVGVAYGNAWITLWCKKVLCNTALLQKKWIKSYCIAIILIGKSLKKHWKCFFYFFSTMKNEEVMTFLMGGIKWLIVYI